MSKRVRQDSSPLLPKSPMAFSTTASTPSSPSQERQRHQSQGDLRQQQQPGKYTHLDTNAATAQQQQEIIHCTLPPHPPLGFPSYSAYELHYNKTHINRCLECNRNFPTDRFLSLHIAENHDPITASLRARGDKTYACFVEGCDRVCSSPQKRRLHLVDKHCFPRDYDFFGVVNEGIDGKGSLLRSERKKERRRRRSSAAAVTAAAAAKGDGRPNKGGKGPGSSDLPATVSPSSLSEESMDEETATDVTTSSPNNDHDVSMDGITDSMAALKFVPKSVMFGRRNPRGGLARS